MTKTTRHTRTDIETRFARAMPSVLDAKAVYPALDLVCIGSTYSWYEYESLPVRPAAVYVRVYEFVAVLHGYS